MDINDNTQAILLLTTHFTKEDTREFKPLGPVEWGYFAEWLHNNNLQPKDLLKESWKENLHSLNHAKVTLERIEYLLERGMAMSLALEKWQRAGLWVMIRSDADYPKLLKQRLGKLSPPVIFGCGEKRLINMPGLAMVGSRNASENDLQLSRKIGRDAANQGYTIVSGAARGVDEHSMLGALEEGGTATGIIADSLLRQSGSVKYRPYILKKDLVLISTFNPEAGFSVGNAMGRNKYIYCMSDAAIVVRTDSKGGTWTGAIENIKNRWVPLWVVESDDPKSGNSKLIQQGGRVLSANQLVKTSVKSLSVVAASEDMKVDKNIGYQRALFG